MRFATLKPLLKEIIVHEPKSYDVASHLAKITRSPEYAAALKKAGKLHSDFQNEVGEVLKKVVHELRGAELAEYENHLQAQALTHALAKFEQDLGHELTNLVTKAREVELAAHEAKLAKKVFAR
jgi:hypothetical protein